MCYVVFAAADGGGGAVGPRVEVLLHWSLITDVERQDKAARKCPGYAVIHLRNTQSLKYHLSRSVIINRASYH